MEPTAVPAQAAARSDRGQIGA